jgi:hypothetical protein
MIIHNCHKLSRKTSCLQYLGLQSECATIGGTDILLAYGKIRCITIFYGLLHGNVAALP